MYLSFYLSIYLYELNDVEETFKILLYFDFFLVSLILL